MSRGSPVPLTEESILSHFSEEDRELLLSDTLTGHWWYEGFTLLLRCFREDKAFTLAGRQWIERRWVDVLKNRLAISRRLPAVDLNKIPIKKPIFIIGPCRTGTTFLQKLLFSDPLNTCLKYYELLQPVVDADTGVEDPRIMKATQAKARMYVTSPAFKTMHRYEAGGPEEDFYLFHNIGVFKDCAFQLSDCREYVKWMEARTNDEMLEAYRFHKQQTQLILHSREFLNSDLRMVFKENFHSLYLAVALKVYPDAIFVHTYRNPSTTVASLCSVRENFKLLTYEKDDVDLKQIGREVLGNSFCHGGIQMMNYRKHNPELEHRFIDIAYDDLATSPMDVVKKIYDHFGLELTDEVTEKMEAYVKENPKNKYGCHEYDLNRYHLTKDEVLKHFKDYVEEYKIPC